jgi:hypothetical protein
MSAVIHHDNSSTLASGFHDQNSRTYVANMNLHQKKINTNDFTQGEWSLAVRRANRWD